jgi:hypothetical protein
MKKILFVLMVILAVIAFSCDTVDTSFDDALPERYTLTTAVEPAGAGNIEPSEGSFVSGTTITIEAIPAEGYIFQQWEGDITGNVNPRPVFFTENRNIRALFQFRDYPLNIEITGEGTVSEEVITDTQQAVYGQDDGTGNHSAARPDHGFTDAELARGTGTHSPAAPAVSDGQKPEPESSAVQHRTTGPDAPQNNTTVSAQETTVTVRLTAQPAEGWIFDRWEGDLSGNTNPETIIVDSEKNVRAVFVQADPDQYTLQLTVQGEGTVTTDPSQDVYDSGEQVSLTASAASGWRFSGWQGDLTGNANPATLEMDSDKEVTAVFVEEDTEQFSLEITVEGEGSVSANPAKEEYDDGEQIILTASAAQGWRFSGWQGDLSGTDNPASLTMNSNKEVTAVFEEHEPDIFSLQINTEGEGTVTTNPSGDEFEEGTEVSLTASAASGWRFTGWRGDLSGTLNPATLMMDDDKEVTAVFEEMEPDMYSLQIGTEGEGTVTSDPPGEEFAEGTEVSLTASAASGWRFTGWQGDLSGTQNPATLVMDEDKNVTAVFEEMEPDQFTLQVSVQGEGSVSVSPSGDEFEAGTQVSLTAAADGGWRFIRWQGDLSGTENPASLLMDEDKEVTAVFQRIGPPTMEITEQPSDATAGNTLSPSPEVRVENDLGNPLGGIDIDVSLSNHSFASGSTLNATTGQDGIAVFDNLEIERASSSYRLIFSADLPEVSDIESQQFAITAASPEPSNSSVDVPDGTSGEETVITIELEDRFENPVGGAAGEISVQISGANNASPDVSETGTTGRYRATYTPVNSGTDQITVELNGSTVGDGPVSSSVSAGEAEEIELVSGNNQEGPVARELDEPFVIRVLDQNDNPVSGQQVEFSIDSTPSAAVGQSMSESEVTTDSDGYASSTLTLGSTPGTYTVVASVNGAGSVTFSAEAVILPPSGISITEQPSRTVAGEAIDPAPAVRLTNILTLPVEGITVRVTLNGGNFANGSTTEAVTDNNGIADFDNLVITKAGTGYRLSFGTPGSDLEGVTSGTFNITAAEGDPSMTTADVPSGVTGQQTRIIITVEDEYGNPVNGTDNLSVGVSGVNTVTVPVNETSTAGEYLAAYTPVTAGIDQISIRLDNVEISGSPYTSEVSAAAVDPSNSSADADPDELKRFETSVVTVELRDEFNNRIPGFGDSDFEISFDGVATAGPVTETSTGGIYQFDVTSDTIGDVEVIITVNGITLDDTPEIEFESEHTSIFMEIHTHPENTLVNQPIGGPPAVRIFNQIGTPIPDIEVEVEERDGADFDSGTLKVLTDENGIATFNDLVFRSPGRYQLEFSADTDPDTDNVNSRSFQVFRR